MSNQVDIKTLSMTELKALAFDLSTEINRLMTVGKAVEQQMTELMSKPGEIIAEVKEETVDSVEPVESQESTEDVDKSE